MTPINPDICYILFGMENKFIYTNHRDETALRHVIPMCLRYGTGPVYPTPRWLLEAYDIDKQGYRTFDLAKVEIETTNPLEKWKCADASNRETKRESETDRPV